MVTTPLATRSSVRVQRESSTSGTGTAAGGTGYYLAQLMVEGEAEIDMAALAADPALQTKVRAAVIVSTPLPWLQSWRGIGGRLIRSVSKRLRTFPARLLKLGLDPAPVRSHADRLILARGGLG